ncbi:unnamed protein product [Effrenium voratum]|uniref:Uncharacterized protein n=1 Tax=Effrenium voratum TaxID=2562239 RepID=A0AA36HX42_9DINO|nr:unnamed protein product [Effrenium voratum]CAJ1429597.1 unnamed protein product [Effrenium voratum]
MKDSLVAFSKWYDLQMKARPLATKALTSALLAACSNVVAQIIQRKAAWREVLSFSMQALPPYSHFWFQLLENQLGPGRAALKTVLDQLLFRPVMLWYCFVTSGLLSGKRWTEVKENIRCNFAKVVVNSWKVWPAAMWLTQKYVPPLYQSTSTDLLSFFWDVYESLAVAG